MCWRDAVTPSTTTILLTLIVLLNTYLVILTARNKGTIIQDSGAFEVKLRNQLEAANENSVKDFRNTLPQRSRYQISRKLINNRHDEEMSSNPGRIDAAGSRTEVVFNDILDHEDSFKDDGIGNSLKEADKMNDKVQESAAENPPLVIKTDNQEIESINEVNEAEVKPGLPQKIDSPNEVNKAEIKAESPQDVKSSNPINQVKPESLNKINKAVPQADSHQEVEISNQLNKAEIKYEPQSPQKVEISNNELVLDSDSNQHEEDVSENSKTETEESEDRESGNLGEGTVPAITTISPDFSSSPVTDPSDVEISRTFNEEGAGDRTVVLLVSDYRSGSSLLGEMFNQNDDVFYLFEPLMGVVEPKNQKKFLERLLTCTPNHWGFLRRSRQSGCGEYIDERDETPEYRQCLRKTNRTAECLKYGITAAKFIRLTSIESIRDFGILDRTNVFVVHSFRDPRGTINSRLSYDVVNYNGEKISRDKLTNEIVGEIADSLCWRYYNDSVFGDSLHNKYIRITYEDVCIDPQTNIERVYEMIGHPVPERVLAWFNEHTHAKSVSAENDKMGLERNAALTAVRWKQELSRDFICAIEHNCKMLMDYLNLEYTCKDINM